MHDPMTVAFEIKSPVWRRSSRNHRYYPPIVTVWHVDPERHAHERGTRGDDTCGWFHPPTASVDRARIRRLGEREYSCLFGKRHATAEGKSYASISNEPTAYDAIYWAWRRIKWETYKGWKYGPSRRALSRSELEEIYKLASNPVDNYRVTIAGIKSADDCGDFFVSLYLNILRFHRPVTDGIVHGRRYSKARSAFTTAHAALARTVTRSP